VEEVTMRRQRGLNVRQHTLPFARQEIWRSMPVEQRRQCTELCEQLLRAVLEGEGQSESEEDRD
jgi:hypothetical protein